MKNFSDFNLKPQTNGFNGDKIKISKILNRPIVVLRYQITDSKYNGKRLDLEITVNGEPHVVFTGAKTLMDMIQQVPGDGFPFTCTIVSNNERYEFT